MKLITSLLFLIILNCKSRETMIFSEHIISGVAINNQVSIKKKQILFHEECFPNSGIRDGYGGLMRVIKILKEKLGEDKANLIGFENFTMNFTSYYFIPSLFTRSYVCVEYSTLPIYKNSR